MARTRPKDVRRNRRREQMRLKNRSLRPLPASNETNQADQPPPAANS